MMDSYTDMTNKSNIQTLLNRWKAFDALYVNHQSDLAFTKGTLNQWEHADQLAKVFTEIEEKDRTLKVGIVGRVKAGKSSLLNALVFGGHPVLPAAATPMTAALTSLSYGETLEAEIEFYAQEDLENIRKGYEDYEKTIQSLIEEKKAAFANMDAQPKRGLNKKHTKRNLPSDEQLREQAVLGLKGNIQLAGTRDQWQRIKNSGIDYKNLPEKEILPAQSMDELANSLRKYVGADGDYMPFTKSVNIRMPLQTLQDMQVVDTPGFNDPVASREKRTNELLKECDVIFIISQAGQLLSDQDMGVLNRITKREGVRHIFIVASQVDTELYASEKKPSLNETLQGLHAKLSLEATNNLETYVSKTQNKATGIFANADGIFDDAIAQGARRFILSSGMCHRMAQTLDKRDSWDDNMRHCWGMLQKKFPGRI
jgi:predicted GTPase